MDGPTNPYLLRKHADAQLRQMQDAQFRQQFDDARQALRQGPQPWFGRPPQNPPQPWFGKPPQMQISPLVGGGPGTDPLWQQIEALMEALRQKLSVDRNTVTNLAAANPAVGEHYISQIPYHDISKTLNTDNRVPMDQSQGYPDQSQAILQPTKVAPPVKAPPVSSREVTTLCWS